MIELLQLNRCAFPIKVPKCNGSSLSFPAQGDGLAATLRTLSRLSEFHTRVPMGPYVLSPSRYGRIMPSDNRQAGS